VGSNPTLSANLLGEREVKMKKDKDLARHFRNIFIAVVLVAELLIVSIELIYLLVGNGSINGFIIDVVVYSILAIGLSLGAYLFVKNTVAKLQKSEARWEKSFNATSEGLFILDNDLTIIQNNRVFAEMLGKGSEEIIGRKCYELLHKTSEPPDFCLTCKAAEARQSAQAEIYEPFLEKYIFASADPSFDDQGNLEFVLHTIRDITKQKEAEQRVKDGLAFRQTILDTIPNPVFYKDANGVYLGCNKAYAELVAGRPRVELIGKTVFDFVPMELAELYHSKDVELLNNPGVQVYESQARFADGILRDVVNYKATFLGPDGGVAGIVGVIIDITERKKMEDALRKNEEKFRFLVENMNDNAFTLDLEARTTYTSPSVKKILGFTPQERLQQTAQEQIVPESLAKLIESLVDELEHDKERDPDRSSTHVADFYHKNGSIVTLEVVTSFIRDGNGNPIGVYGLSRDITERKKAEEKIREAEKKYRELAEALPQTVFETDSGGILTYVNETALRMFGYTKAEFESGVNALEVIAEEDRERVAGAMAKMITGQSTGAEREYFARRKDRTTFPCIVYSALITDDQGNPTGIRGLLTDISERKELENELRRLNTELEGYAHTVSHDLKNPIAIVAMACGQVQSALEKQPLDSESKEALTHLMAIGKQGVERTIKLIDDILLLAEAGTKKNVESVDVTEIVKTVIFEKSPEIEEKKFKVEIDADLGTIFASPVSIYQVFVNLVRNSLKHNTNDHPELEIRRLESKGVERRYLVRDNGPGIPEELLGTIFTPFTKGKATGESGIGLSIVERIIKAYDGEIKVYNDNGACVEFTLRSVE
jgi:PAS domain S-box-containing protein